ncbi:hypothetical protein THRCLA_21851 [Thraustotheca clavata]|uniref:Uncharacterized protein n=1 Tax=Thraustotheca clavata TaxID=74557 RepID=A0A1V9ZMV6_9STRA|nr:hypothetical protein THRCLA_21851 [Thraustotheca clavata]
MSKEYDIYASLPPFDVHNHHRKPTAQQQEYLSWELIEASTSGNHDQLIKAIQHRADLDCRYKGCTPLYYASKNGFTMLVRSLLSYGAHLETRNSKGRTALMIACSRGHIDTVHVLLHNGAKVNCTDHSGATPRHLALRNGHSAVVHLLDTQARMPITRTNAIDLRLKQLTK